MSNVTKPIALDESINTTENTPRNIADVLADELSNIADKIQGGGSGGSGGHIIQNASGANLTQRGTMQFVDSHATDNSAGEKTVIENIKSVTEADFRTATEDGLYDVDVEGAEIGEISEEYVEVTADGVKTWSQLLDSLFTLVDASKLTDNTLLVFTYSNGGKGYYGLAGNYLPTTLNELRFTYTRTSNSSIVVETCEVKSSGSKIYNGNNNTITDVSSGIGSGKITLYYGTDKAVVDLQTTANRCLMSNGDTVEQSIKNLEIDATTYGTSTNYVEDFNSITQTGEYWCNIKLNITLNNPTSYNGVLRVINVGDGIIQVYIDRTNANMFTRSYRTSWSAWRMVTQNTI